MTDITLEGLEEKLWKAAARGDCQTIRMLAVTGVDIDARNEDGFTAFNIATQNGHSEAATTILAAREMQYARSIGVDPAELYGSKNSKDIQNKKKSA